MTITMPFEQYDMAAIDPQPSQSALSVEERRTIGRMMHQYGQWFTIRNDAGRILFCGGAQQQHPEYLLIMALFADGLLPGERLSIARKAKRWVDGLTARRVEAQVNPDDIAALRFAAWVGLQPESVKRAAAQDGSDLLVLVKVKGNTHGA